MYIVELMYILFLYQLYFLHRACLCLFAAHLTSPILEVPKQAVDDLEAEALCSPGIGQEEGRANLESGNLVAHPVHTGTVSETACIPLILFRHYFIFRRTCFRLFGFLLTSPDFNRKFV